MRLPRVSSINGAIVGTEAAIIMVFDSMLSLLDWGWMRWWGGEGYLVQMKRSAEASAFVSTLFPSQGEGGVQVMLVMLYNVGMRVHLTTAMTQALDC